MRVFAVAKFSSKKTKFGLKIYHFPVFKGKIEILSI